MIGDLFDSPWKILIVAVVLIVLFGSTKLPVAARSLGRSMRILKSEVSGLHEDEAEPETAPATAAWPAAPQQIAASAPAPQPAAANGWGSAATGAAAAAAQPLNAQQQIDSLQQQIRELKESSVEQPTASVPADQKPV
jgi:sec-independent protein translocase protein TatA